MHKAKVCYENSEDSSSFLLFGNPLTAPLVSGEGQSSGPQDLTENQLTTISGPISSSSALTISPPAEEDFPTVCSTNIIQDLPYSSQPAFSQFEQISVGTVQGSHLVQPRIHQPPLKKPRTSAGCYQFLKSGYCSKGNSCDYSHVLRDNRVTPSDCTSISGTQSTSEKKEEAELLLKLRLSKARAKQIEYLRNKALSTHISESLDPPVVHVGFFCAYGCSLSPITGVRYTCSICTSIHYCNTCESRKVHNPDHPLLKYYKAVQSDVSPRISTVSSADNSSAPEPLSFSPDPLCKNNLTSPSISSFSSTAHSSISLLPDASSLSFDSSRKDFLDMSIYISPITSISTDHLSLLDTDTFLTELYSAPISFDKILILSKEASRRSFLDMKGSRDTVDSLFNSALPLIKRARKTFMNTKIEIKKHYQLHAQLSRRKRDRNFPKATALRVPAFQYQKNVDHTADKNNVTSIIRNANMALMDVAISATSKDISRAIESAKSVQLSSARLIFNSIFCPSAPLCLQFVSIDTNILKISRMLAFFRLYEFLTSTLETAVKDIDGSASIDRTIMPIAVTKDPQRLNA
jgi:hypothetical protein